MKDKELRILLGKKGILNCNPCDGTLASYEYGFMQCQHIVLCEMVQDLKHELARQKEVSKELHQVVYGTKGKLKTLEAKFDALTAHMMLIVAKPKDKFTVTELNK